MSPYNHGSLKTERHARTMSEKIAGQLSDTHQLWRHYLKHVHIDITVL